MFEAIASAVFWAAANVLYLDLRRKGRRGFGRLVFFWMGTPATWLWLFLIPEGKPDALGEGEDDVDQLMEEIRRERALADPTRPGLPGGCRERGGDADGAPAPAPRGI